MNGLADKRPDSTFRVMKWLLGAQIALAALMIVIDLAPTIPSLVAPSSAPELDRPTGPGDQVRLYRPNRPATPGPGVDPDMPRRLITEDITIDGTQAMRIRGAITPGDGARIRDELQVARPTLVALDSPGGSVEDALTIGRALREIGAATRLRDNAVCLSACPYIFVGGTTRSIAQSARLGVHQHSFGESTIQPAFLAVEDIQRGQAGVLNHLDEMGIDLRIMGPAMATPADEIYILTANELRDWNVVTEDTE